MRISSFAIAVAVAALAAACGRAVGSMAARELAPAAVVDRYNVDMGNVSRNPGKAAFVLSNKGIRPLHITSLTTTCTCTTAAVVSQTLKRNESEVISVTFGPISPGSHVQYIVICTNDPAAPRINLRVSGSVARR